MNSSTDLLVQMANDIADYFSAEPDPATATTGVVSHIKRFWDPRMRRKLIAHLSQGGAGLNPLAKSAAEQIAAEQTDTATER